MKKTISNIVIISIFLTTIVLSSISYAQPYGKGIYNSNAPYGSQTSLSISTNGDINVPITPGTGGALATGTSIVTIASTDVVGYKLYIRALTSTDMNNGGTLLHTSANDSPAPLAVNTWGYNTDASVNFKGITLTDVLIRSATLPAPAGEVTNVTYGMNIDLLQPIGDYSTQIVYTAVPQTN